jgi:hypothetical protein
MSKHYNTMGFTELPPPPQHSLSPHTMIMILNLLYRNKIYIHFPSIFVDNVMLTAVLKTI